MKSRRQNSGITCLLFWIFCYLICSKGKEKTVCGWRPRFIIYRFWVTSVSKLFLEYLATTNSMKFSMDLRWVKQMLSFLGDMGYKMHVCVCVCWSVHTHELPVCVYRDSKMTARIMPWKHRGHWVIFLLFWNNQISVKSLLFCSPCILHYNQRTMLWHWMNSSLILGSTGKIPQRLREPQTSMQQMKLPQNPRNNVSWWSSYIQHQFISCQWY